MPLNSNTPTGANGQRLDTQGLQAKRFRIFNSQIKRYLEDLKLGQNYSAQGAANPYSPVVQSKPATNLFILTLIPPDVFPSGKTTQAKYPFPANANFALTNIPKRRGSLASGVGTTDVTYQGFGVPLEQEERSEDYLSNLQARVEALNAGIESVKEENSSKAVLALGEDTSLNDTGVKAARDLGQDVGYLRAQVLKLLDLPPLVFLIPPATLTRSYSKVLSDGARTRLGPKVEEWGEEQTQLSMSGTIGAFMTHNLDRSGEGNGGLHSRAIHSGSYQQLMELYTLYRHNAYILNEDKTIAMVGAVQIYYDGRIYTGSLKSFNMTSSQDNPYNMTYDLTMTLTAEQDTQRA